MLTPLRSWVVTSGLISLVAAAEAGAAEPAPSWVFFADKDIDGHEESALGERAAAIAPRALERRQRTRRDRGVDVRDVDVAPRFVAAVAATGARVRATSRWLNAVSVVADAAELAAIARLPHVRAVAPVARHARPRWLPPPNRPVVPYGGSDYGVAFDQLAMIEVPQMHDCGLSGAGVVVAVLDSGFTLDHQAFANLDVLAEHDFIHDDGETADEPGDPAGQQNHGTMVLSLLAGSDPGLFMGAAPDVTVILGKTEDISFEQPIEEDWFVEGLEWAESLGADILSASLIYVDWYMPSDLDGQTAVTTIAAGVAMENGLVMITAAGNWGPGDTSIGAPADADGLIAVGAVDLAGIVTGFSSRGPTFDGRIKPDVAALGQDDWIVVPGTVADYGQGNGTSFATPLVAGVAAMLEQAYPALGPAEMHALLTSTATQPAMPDNAIGYGIVRGYTAAGLYCTCHDVDADGAFDAACGGDDCDDGAPDVGPAATELCNGRDDDCNDILGEGEDDADGDGALACDDDCDDTDADVRPGATELCDDGVDNDCDGTDDACEPDPEPEPVVPGAPPPPEDEGSCGCRAAVGSDDGALPLFAVALILAARRRQTRSSTTGGRAVLRASGGRPAGLRRRLE
jgi:MYXO-CTERM domain-containing protein